MGMQEKCADSLRGIFATFAKAFAVTFFGILFVAVLAIVWAMAAHAQEGRFYLGLGAAADAQEFTYGKTVYTPEGLTRNEATSAKGDADRTLLTLGAFGGYRWPLPGSSLHLSAEVDVACHPKKLKGRLAGTGYSWTDTWPEDWWLKRNYSYGFTLKFGGPLGNSVGLYALAGLRGVKTEFSITETGCPGPDLQCPPTPLASFTEKVDRSFSAWTLGAGLERRLGEQFAAQLEVRRTDYQRKSWDRLFDEGAVIIPSTLNGRETTAALRLVRYF